MKITSPNLHPWVRSGCMITLTIGLAGALAAQQPANQVAAPKDTSTKATEAEGTAATDKSSEDAGSEAEAKTNVAGESALTGSITPEAYLLGQSGYQVWVRKYEGQRERDRPFSIGTLNIVGYNRALQFFVDGNDVLSRNGILNADIGLTDKIWVRASNGTLIRRIAVPYPNLVPTAAVLNLDPDFLALPVVPAFVMSPSRELFNPVIPLNGITPSSEFRIDRNENSAKLALKPFKSDRVQFFGDLWTSKQTGNRPLIFRSRRSNSPTAAVAGVSGVKFLTTEPVDSTTFDSGIGANFTVGPALLSYRASWTKYENRVAGPVLPAGFPPAPTSPAERISDSRYNDTDTTNHTAKLAVPFGKDFSFTGNWIRRNRTHETAGLTLLENTIPGTTTPIVLTDDVKSRLDTKTAALRYSGVNNLQLTARYRDFDLSRSAPLVPTATGFANQSVSRREKEGELEASYSGLSSTLIRASIAKNKTKRDSEAIHDVGHEEWEHPALAGESNTKTIRLGVTNYSLHDLSLRANWKKDKTRHSAFHGTPSDSDEINLGLNYTPREDMGFSADFRRLDEKNKLLPEPGFLTTAILAAQNPGLTAAEIATLYTEMREAQAGARYSNKADTIVLGVFKSFGSKLTLDANFTSDKTKSQSYWIFGIDSPFPPHIGGQGDPTGEAPELVPYDAKTRSVSAGLTYAATKKLSLRSNLMLGRSNGSTNTLSLFRLVPPVGDKAPPEGDWQPFDARFHRIGLGAAYRTSPTQQVLAQLDFNNWKDKIEPNYSGKYTLLTVGYKVDF